MQLRYESKCCENVLLLHDVLFHLNYIGVYFSLLKIELRLCFMRNIIT